MIKVNTTGMEYLMNTVKISTKGFKNWVKPNEIASKQIRVSLHTKLPRELVDWFAFESAQSNITKTILVETALNTYRQLVEENRGKRR